MANVWSFEHDEAIGLVSRQRASTDALNALAQWIVRDPRRAFKVVTGEDADDVLVAELSTDHDDAQAGNDLDEACADYGVRRAQVLWGRRTVH